MNTYSNYKIQNCKNTHIFISKFDKFRLRTIFSLHCDLYKRVKQKQIAKC